MRPTSRSLSRFFIHSGTSHSLSIKPKQLQEYLYTYGVIIAHIVLVAITGVITVLEPVFAKLLKKINTSVELEETNIASIDIVDEE